MSLYYEAADALSGPSNAGGSLKSRVFSNANLKSAPAQVYALAVETCKWSSVLKEVIENASLLRLERKLTPLLALLLVHDLLLAKRGISLPASHGLKAATERHKARLQAELTKARLRRSLGSIEALTNFIESGEADTTRELPHPRWIRVNTLKAELDEVLRTIFKDYERVRTVEAVRPRGSPRLYIDNNVPNLIALPSSVDLTKTEAYKSGVLIFQDKASCFPAYLLDHRPDDGDLMDTCAAPGNKTTHLAAIVSQRTQEGGEVQQIIHAFERDKLRAKTLQKMVALAGSEHFTTIHGGQDFLKVDSRDPTYKSVGALLLDPSCSGSGIVGRDEMPELHIPELKTLTATPSNSPGTAKPKEKQPQDLPSSLKRKREHETNAPVELMIDDDGNTIAVTTTQDLQKRLAALSAFQVSLLLHAFSFPSAHKITYSTCSIHAEENESVVIRALASPVAVSRGWRILKRDDQVRGMKEWPIRGAVDAYPDQPEIADACIRANKGDQFGTMGFFVAGFVRDMEQGLDVAAIERGLQRDERGLIIRDANGIPVKVGIIESAVGADKRDDDDKITDFVAIEKSLVRDARGIIVRDRNGIPIRPGTSISDPEDDDEEEWDETCDNEEWNGFSDGESEIVTDLKEEPVAVELPKSRISDDKTASGRNFKSRRMNSLRKKGD